MAVETFFEVSGASHVFLLIALEQFCVVDDVCLTIAIVVKGTFVLVLALTVAFFLRWFGRCVVENFCVVGLHGSFYVFGAGVRKFDSVSV